MEVALSQGVGQKAMKLEIHKPKVTWPVITPFGIMEKEFTVTARLNPEDEFTVEAEVEVITSESSRLGKTGIIFRKITVIADQSAPIGVNTTHLRSIQLKGLLEAIIHKTAISTRQRVPISEINALKSPSQEQITAAEIVLMNPGVSHAHLISEELGITLQSARNLLTRTRKSGLLPSARTSEPVEVIRTIPEMSEEGAYIERVLMGKLPPASPRQRRAHQESRTKKKGRPKNGKSKSEI